MGLARIITRLSSGYDEIERDLRARGFQVERSSPDEPGAQPADLEITIEECTAEQALIRAMDGGGDASVFVAPGALTGRAQPIAAIPFVPSFDRQFPPDKELKSGLSSSEKIRPRRNSRRRVLCSLRGVLRRCR